MKEKKYIIGNWKSHKTAPEVTAWFSAISPRISSLTRDHHLDQYEIILCIPTIFLPLASEAIIRHRLPFHLASQNISPFPMGPYTGEINAEQIKPYAQYALIGHSERRTKFHENDTEMAEKALRAVEQDMTPILCISESTMPIPPEVTLVAYEPIASIGTGNALDPEKAGEVARTLKSQKPSLRIIYGGSVTAENIASYLSHTDIDGVLPGSSSLHPSSFCDMIIHATRI